MHAGGDRTLTIGADRYPRRAQADVPLNRPVQIFRPPLNPSTWLRAQSRFANDCLQPVKTDPITGRNICMRKGGWFGDLGNVGWNQFCSVSHNVAESRRAIGESRHGEKRLPDHA